MVDQITPEEVFSLLSVKDGMNDSRYFVGRKELLSNLNACVTGKQRNSIWIYGPRRIGKSSVAKMLMRNAEDNGTCVLWIDAIDLAREGFNGVLKRTLDKACNCKAIKGKTILKRFECLASVSKLNPLLIIYDEFDKIAIGMRTDEQAFLRRLATEYDSFSYIFISCYPPHNIIEEVPEVNSRLLGICNQQKIMPLERRDVKELCKKVGQDLNIQKLSLIASTIRNKVGGFPVAVKTLVKALSIGFYHNENLDEEEIEERMQCEAQQLEVDFHQYWNSLHPESRMVLSGKAKVDDYIQKLKEDGLYNNMEKLIKPLFIIDTAKKAEGLVLVQQSNSSEIGIDLGSVVYLMKTIGEINESLMLRGYRDGFNIGRNTVQFWKLTRSSKSLMDFKEGINFLYNLFYLGVKNKDETYNLPSQISTLYNESSVIRDIYALHNYYYNDKSQGSNLKQQEYWCKKSAHIFYNYCNSPEPTTIEKREYVIKGLVTELCKLLQILYEKIQSEEINNDEGN